MILKFCIFLPGETALQLNINDDLLKQNTYFFLPKSVFPIRDQASGVWHKKPHCIVRTSHKLLEVLLYLELLELSSL